jgi:hypothetical protein
VTEPGADGTTAKANEKVLADFWMGLERRVETLLRTHCARLIALADSLLKRSSLSRREVLEILEPPEPADGEKRPAPSCTEMDLVPREEPEPVASAV